VPVLNLSGNVIGADADEREARTRRIVDVIARCPEYGFRIINGYAGSIIVDRGDWSKNGSAVCTDEQYEWAAAAYRRFGEAAERAGVTLTLEVHMNTIHDTARAAIRLLDMIGSPAVQANLDTGNMHGVRTAEPAAEAIQLLAGRIAFTHFKNARRVSYSPVGVDYNFLLSQGEIDHYAVVRDLRLTGFDGPYGLEWSGQGDPHLPSREDIAYLRSILDDIATFEREPAIAGPTAGANEEPL
jgi:sugar phosphate isomerase/epimerase